MPKKITFTLYAIVILVMVIATFAEKNAGTPFVHSHIYGSWWFCMLWGVMMLSAIVYFICRKVRRPSVILLHSSFIIILIGALLTHLTSWQGKIHLRRSMPVSMYASEEADGTSIHELPFTVTLETFTVQYHKGTEAPADFLSQFTITDHGIATKGMVSMNNIFTHRGIRFYQSSYDPDMEGCTLSINSDPWGIPVTYFGYAMLLLSMLICLFSPKNKFRTLLRKASKQNTLLSILILSTFSLFSCSASASNTLTLSQAKDLGALCINYNDRICPIQTLALDFTRKIHGSNSYENYSAEQVLAGFILNSKEWNTEPIIYIKNKDVREHFRLAEYTSVVSFFDAEGYRLQPVIEEYYQGRTDKFHEEVVKLDDKLVFIMQVSSFDILRVFPYKGRWYSPADCMPADIEAAHKDYIRHAFTRLSLYSDKGDEHQTSLILSELAAYQRTYGADELPSELQMKSEFLYNAIPFAKALSMLSLAFALLSLVQKRWLKKICLSVLIISALSLTLCIVLRWIVSSTIPMTNGYETMILMAWIVCLAALLLYRRFHIILTFGLMLTGFLLLVAHLGQIDPKISNLMPVLASPLLSIHVSCVIMAYALLSITFACAIYGLIQKKKSDEMHLLSQLMLYPGVFLLAAGIFIGAIWANVSWGRYWGWDPKEVWALITLLIYAFAMHDGSIKWMRSSRHYHIYMIISFFAILITYFGVNFFFGGMHSYGNS